MVKRNHSYSVGDIEYTANDYILKCKTAGIKTVMITGDSLPTATAIAKRVCTKLYNNNELNRRVEEQTRAYDLKKGRTVHDWFLYEHESYEPYAIECGKDII